MKKDSILVEIIFVFLAVVLIIAAEILITRFFWWLDAIRINYLTSHIHDSDKVNFIVSNIR